MAVQTRTTAILLIVTFFHAIAFLGGECWRFVRSSVSAQWKGQARTIFPCISRCLGPQQRGQASGKSIGISWILEIVMITTPRMLPFSLGASLFAAISGLIVTKTGKYRPVIWVSLIATIVGFGLMSTLDSRSNTFVIARTPQVRPYSTEMCFSRAKKVLYPLVAAAGLGGLLQVCTESCRWCEKSELMMMGRRQ